jgi:signal transduction histidine kinase
MTTMKNGRVHSCATILLTILGWANWCRGADSTGGASGASADARAQSQAQANPGVENQRQEAEREARKTLDQDAAAAIAETGNAVKAVAQGKTDQAISSIERAIGKINVLLARNPANALIPVELQVDVIDAAPWDGQTIRLIGKAAERAVEDRDYPGARVLLQHLISEIRVRTYNLPLSTYPSALKEAARLIDQKRQDEAKAVLQTALNTLAVIDHVRPLPLAAAQDAVERAQALRDKDKDAAQRLLAEARTEIDRARDLGYAGKDPEYAALNQAISDVEKQLKGNQDSTSAFAKLKDKVKSFFKRQSDSEKKAEVASR